MRAIQLLGVADELSSICSWMVRSDFIVGHVA